MFVVVLLVVAHAIVVVVVVGVPVFCGLSAGIPTISKLLIHIYKLAKFCEKRKALPTTLWALH